MTRMLKVRYRNGTEFLEHYQSSFLYGGLFYPTREAIPLGEAVVMEVRFPELEDRVLLRGFVAWRRQGRYRIVYSIQDEVLTVVVVKVGHRKDVYR